MVSTNLHEVKVLVARDGPYMMDSNYEPTFSRCLCSFTQRDVRNMNGSNVINITFSISTDKVNFLYYCLQMMLIEILHFQKKHIL